MLNLRCLTAGLLVVSAVLGFHGRPDTTAHSNPSADPAVVPDAKTPTAEQAWRRLKDGNARFAANATTRPDLSAPRRKELAGGQKPFAVVLTCADSRLVPEYIFNQGLGDLFVVRVAGNIADPYALGSVEYAVEHLHVPLVVLLGHEKCGAVEAALAPTRPPGNLGKLIAEIHPGRGLPDTPSSALPAAIENNARYQAHLLSERSPVLRTHLEKKQLRIVSGVYHLATGKVKWLEDQ